MARDEGGQLEDVRMSNFAYSQTKIAEYLSFYFASIGVGSSIVASELTHYYNDNDENKEHIITLLAIANISTALLSKHHPLLTPLVLSIIGEYLMHVDWLKTKKQLGNTDNIFNSGIWQYVALETFMSLVMNYPFLYGHTYQEDANNYSINKWFYSNDLLLCFMIFCRIHFLIRTILSISFYTDPRAQRVCTIYGCDANNSFALKALMKESSWKVLFISLMIGLMTSSY